MGLGFRDLGNFASERVVAERVHMHRARAVCRARHLWVELRGLRALGLQGLGFRVKGV